MSDPKTARTLLYDALRRIEETDGLDPHDKAGLKTKVYDQLGRAEHCGYGSNCDKCLGGECYALLTTIYPGVTP